MSGYLSLPGSGIPLTYCPDYRGMSLPYPKPVGDATYLSRLDGRASYGELTPLIPSAPWLEEPVRSPNALDAVISPLSKPAAYGPIDAFLSGKRDSLANEVESVMGMIYEREQLLEENLQQIEYGASLVKTQWLDLREWCRPGINSDVDKLRSNLERELIGFEREKRLEQNGCWRDVARLKSQLADVLREFRQQTNREGLLARTGEETWTSERSADD